MIEFKYTKDGRLQAFKDGKPAGYIETMGDAKRKGNGGEKNGGNENFKHTSGKPHR